MTAYASYLDLVERCDERVLTDLASDDNEPEADPVNNTKITGALDAASGMIEAACFTAELYTPDQLNALTGNAEALLKDIVCQLALVRLIRRRPEKYAADDVSAMREEAEEYLDRLRKGERLFWSIDGTQAGAGLPTVNGPTAITYARLNMLPDRTKNFYPARITRLPIGR